MPQHIVIVADDVTGACDSAAAFVGCGRVRMVLDGVGVVDAKDPGEDTAEIVSITTESRDLAAVHAAARVTEAIEGVLQAGGDTLVFKKVDSAGRGQFAAEIEAALAASGAALALVAPAFPEAGRTVLNGVLSVRDCSGQDRQISLPELFSADAALRVALLAVSSETDLHAAIAGAIESEVRILICDAVEQTDLERLAAAALRIAQPILWAGSAGLARALALQMQAAEVSRKGRTSAPVALRAGGAILFTGTPHPVTALQVARLERGLSGEHRRAIYRVAEAGASHEAVVAAFLSQDYSAVILNGGDTAAFVLRALGARAIGIAGEVAPGMPWGMIEGGVADGRAVVTKSGGFGERDALVRAFEFCESKFCESGIYESGVLSTE
ncbi:MAG TPA: four-carbon acid sugar kinase family protein [Acidobacteriaceae bacterium]